jgi:succinate dehydrogenase / fumarate reductase flavoprotein subunit
MYARHEMVEGVIIDGKARGILSVRGPGNPGNWKDISGMPVVLASGGYGNVFYLLHQCHEQQRDGYLESP